ncbi:MAG: hypothetical protein KDE46_24975, partial [Caldilineaceae bacterium]|nr:hypothetical protein [Caldilineaceae bacterium]
AYAPFFTQTNHLPATRENHVATTTSARRFTHRAVQAPPPGLPTRRAFQAAQGEVAWVWLAQRTGWP